MKSATWFGVALVLALLNPEPAQSQSGPGSRPRRFDQGPKPGSMAPDFTLKTIEGKTIRASVLWSNKPVVIMTGSYTCPVFRGKVSAFEQLAHDFGKQVNFIVLYTQEAHPKGDPSPYRGREWTTPANEREGILFRQPKTGEERLERARTCTQKLKLTLPVVVDSLDNTAWAAYGSAPNSACLVGQDGKVVEQQGWFDPARMRAAIEAHLKRTAPKPLQ
jgi:hypothetical protein